MWVAVLIVVAIVGIVIFDVVQKKHAILHNFPIIGHFRYLLEAVGPELRQYIVTNNDEERPFSRDQRQWIYTASKKMNTYVGFGSDNEMELSPHYIVIKHSPFPVSEPQPDSSDYDPEYRIPCAKTLGGYRSRAKAFRPPSVVNISGMSFGSLSAPAIEALNKGARLAGCMHNTGEGAVSPHHLHGADLILQIGTGYFGCRDSDGRFSLERLVDLTQKHPQIRAIEIKMSQGAKAGIGGILPAKKISPEIAALRGIPLDRDCISPAAHREFSDPSSLLDFVEHIADETGLPVGVKSAIGEVDFWHDLARCIATTDRAIDFLTVDGGEGGTGAGPLVFSDHVALPFKIAFGRVYREFAEQGIQEKVVFVGSGKLGLPENALFAFALGCDMVAVAREAMLAIGCIQAQKCHTGHCPTGVTTHNPWLIRGLDPAVKSVRLANYVITLRKKLLKLSRACGVVHPALVSPNHIEVLDDRFGSKNLNELFGYSKDFGLPSSADRDAIETIMAGEFRSSDV